MTGMELALIPVLVVRFHDLSYSGHQTPGLQYPLPAAVRGLTRLGVLAAVLRRRSCVCLLCRVCPVAQDRIGFISSPAVWLGGTLCVWWGGGIWSAGADVAVVFPENFAGRLLLSVVEFLHSQPRFVWMWLQRFCGSLVH